MKLTDLIHFSKELIAIDTTNPPGISPEIIRTLTRFFDANDIPCRVESIEGAESVFAEISFAHEGPTLCWIGHWDVVPPGPLADWTVTQPFDPVVKDGNLYGRGACDMKTGLSAAMFAAADLRTDPALCGKLVLALLADEECGGGKGGAQLLPRYHREMHFDYAIVGEPTGFSLRTSRRGVCWGRIRFHGKQAHAAHPNEGDNPIEKAARAITALASLDFHVSDEKICGAPTLSVTSVHAGEKDNVIPGEAEIGLDIRTTPSQTEASVQAAIMHALERAGIPSSQYDVQLKWLADAYVTGDEKFVAVCRDELAHALGGPPDISRDGGTSDGRFLAYLGVPVVEIGLDNTTLHQANEHCKVESLFKLQRIYSRIFRRLLHRPFD